MPSRLFSAAARRLAKRPQGVTNWDLAQATGMTSEQVGSQLAQMTRHKTLVKLKTIGLATRWFLTEAAALEHAERVGLPAIVNDYLPVLYGEKRAA